MRKYTPKQFAAVCAAILTFALVVCAALWAQEYTLPSAAAPTASEESPASADAVVFSLPSGFYSEDQVLSLQAPGAEQILYTTDGTDPRASGLPYDGSFKLPARDETAAYLISACAVYPDGTMSDQITCSYFVSNNIDTRFDCLVFSITIDPDDLYGYENGLFVPGKARGDYLAANPDLREEDLSMWAPANWDQRGRESERNAYVEVYEYDGTRVVAQPCGFRIFGGASRAYDQKNIRLYARSEYDAEDNRFRYEFFPEAKDSLGQTIDSYKRISLRVCGNDYGSLFLREDMISSMAHDISVEAKFSRPAAVFLNGEYYTFAWCQQVFTGDLLDHQYNLEESEWDIFAGNDWVEEEDYEQWQKAYDDWWAVCDYAYLDLTNDKTFGALCQRLDVDNFLTYYAFNSYIGNTDWPYSNIKMFRYSTDRNAPAEPALLSPGARKITDGRWRFFSYDTDCSLGLYDPPDVENIKLLFNEDYFGYWDEVEGNDFTPYNRSDLLMALCEREDVRERFLTLMCDMISRHCSAERVTDALYAYHDWRLQELMAAHTAGLVPADDIDDLEEELEYLQWWIQERPAYALKQLQEVFPAYSEYVSISAKPTQRAVIYVSTVPLSAEDGSFDGTYFAGTDIPVSCTLEPGYEFDHWEINGERVEQQSFNLNSDAFPGEQLNLTLHVRRADTDVRISEARYKGGSDYFVITNYGSQAVSTLDMSVWDGNAQKAFPVPEMLLGAGESLKFVCSNYTGSDASDLTDVPFNLKEGETLTLYAADSSVISSLPLSNGTQGTVLKLNTTTGRYEEHWQSDL